MSVASRKPLIVQGDRRIFLQTDRPGADEARDFLMLFAELEKSPERVHVYRVTPISLWNAAARGMDVSEILDFLREYGQFPVPASLRQEIEDFVGRYGKLQLHPSPRGGLELRCAEGDLLSSLLEKGWLDGFLAAPGEAGADRVEIRSESRGQLKFDLVKRGYPVEDLAGYEEGRPFVLRVRDRLPDGARFRLRSYQIDAVDAFHAGGTRRGGSGVIVLPCGAGKTIVGIGVLEKIGSEALILSTNITSLRQWKRELLEKTSISPDAIGEYSGERKQIRPITLSTYQILTYRRSRAEPFRHFHLFTRHRWGLIVYDEVHLLPAPVFRATAEIQATRRLGLTATLVREDGREAEVFSLIGPRRYDVAWKSLEAQGWIAGARCVEIRVDLDPRHAARYAAGGRREKFRIASENEGKDPVVRQLVRRHRSNLVLVIGQYLDQLRRVSAGLGAPLITGRTRQADREALFDRFRRGVLSVLVVSKVGNFAVDLPDANVAIQISGTFGSRQEEAQRLGRILRPKRDGSAAVFYSLVTRGTPDQDFAEKRQLFLTEQGYRYRIEESFASEPPGDSLRLPGDRHGDASGLRAFECS